MGWRIADTTLVLLGGVATIVFAFVGFFLPEYTSRTNVATLVSGFIAVLSNFTPVKQRVTENETASDDFKKLAADIQYDGLIGQTIQMRADVEPYVTRFKDLITKHDDPGVSMKHLDWVHGQILEIRIDPETRRLVEDVV